MEYIEREAAMYAVRRTAGDYAAAFVEIRRLPAADVAPVRHGRWIAIKVPNEWDKGQCSECRSIFNSSVYGTNYCPKCGTKMDGGAENAR